MWWRGLSGFCSDKDAYDEAVEGQSFGEDEDHADVELGLLRVGPDAGVTDDADGHAGGEVRGAVEEAVGLGRRVDAGGDDDGLHDQLRPRGAHMRHPDAAPMPGCVHQSIGVAEQMLIRKEKLVLRTGEDEGGSGAEKAVDDMASRSSLLLLGQC
jgi:hypothetical protein